MRPLHRPVSVALVVAAAIAGAAGGLGLYTFERRLSVGEVHLSADLGHRGALDLYVPLVDWGVRFPVVRLPVRLRIDVRTIDRAAAVRVGEAGRVDVVRLRRQARSAVEAYVRRAVVVVFLSALALGVLVALAVRGGAFPWTLAAAGATAVAAAVAVALLLPPRGELRDPEFYAQGADIPRALDAVRQVARSARTLRDELDEQLVGLARIVSAPGSRPPLAGLPRVTVASDLHNNVLALPTLESAADRGPVLFAGDLTDRGTPLETALTRRIVRAGRPFVFVSGNHDSDALVARLARAGAIVLGSEGRVLPGGRRGDVVADVGALRVAGYEDPNVRRREGGYRDRGTRITQAEKDNFAAWLDDLVARVDVVMVHDPRLLERALRDLRRDPPARPLVFVTGHTHEAKVERPGERVVVVNGGTVGGGGTGNLDEDHEVGLARLTYDTHPFEPVTADLVEIDPGNGSSRAERHRLDVAAED